MVILWTAFIVLILIFLALDLGVFNRKAHVIGIREALLWTGIWVAAALAFDVGVYFIYQHHLFGIGEATATMGAISGKTAALDFLTGYLLEKSLSLDNVFVIALIFSYFAVPDQYQHRVLFWGILGALVMRGTMILAGAALIQRFDWIAYVFGILLIITAIKMLVTNHTNVHPDRNPLIRLAKKIYPVTDRFHGQEFWVKTDAKLAMTPLFLAMLLVESADVMFAIDSIPAIFAVTRDPFIVFTSNVFAILGLRSLYFALAGMIDRFRYLKLSLVVILAFVGVKMLLSHQEKYAIPTHISLMVILAVLLIAIVASVMHPARPEPTRSDA